MCGGMTAQNFNNELAASVFFDEAAPDIQKCFKEHVPGWQGETLQKILSVAVFMFDGQEEKHRAELAKEKKQEKQQEASLLVAQSLQLRGRGSGLEESKRGQEVGRTERFERRMRRLGNNWEEKCHYSGKLGHWQGECLLHLRGSRRELDMGGVRQESRSNLGWLEAGDPEDSVEIGSLWDVGSSA